jgi:hypothetical protein
MLKNRPERKSDCELSLDAEIEGEDYVLRISVRFGSDNEDNDADDHFVDDDDDDDNEELHSPPKYPGISRPSNRCRGNSCHGRGSRSNTSNVTTSADEDLHKFGGDGTMRQLADIGNKATSKVIL